MAELMAPIGSEEMPLTNGELSAFRRCRRKWHIKYRLGLDSSAPPSDAISTGLAVHELLSRYYSGETLCGGSDLASIMVSGYIEWVESCGLDSRITDVVTEKSLKAKLSENIWLMSRPDLYFNVDGNPVMVDFKTVNSINQFAEGGVRDTQPLHYAAVHYLLTGSVPSFSYRLLRRVRRTSTAMPPFYGVTDVYHNEQDVMQYIERVRAQVRDMCQVNWRSSQVAYMSVGAYPTPAYDCAWSCPFSAICPNLDKHGHSIDRLLSSLVDSDPLAHHK